MTRRALAIGFAVAVLASGNLFAQTYGAVLTGSQEVPPCSTYGFGNATVTFDSARQNINVTITVANLGSPIILSHIHEGPAGPAGPVVIGFVPPNTFTNNTMTGTFAVTDSALVQRILQTPGNFYVNVHTSACPSGAVRGQLSLISGGPVMYSTELRPQNEVPPATGNAFGSGLATIDPINNTIAWEVNDKGIVSPTLSHIHRGAAGVAGPVIINFATSAAQIPNGHTSGSGSLAAQSTATFQPATDVPALSSALTAFGYYINVHSQAFPGGEIRGQLQPAQELDIPVAGHVAGISGTFISDVRVFNPSFDTATTALVEFFPAGATSQVAANSLAVNLPPRGTAILNDIAGASGLNVTGTGALRITSVANLVATSRIYLNSSTGTFGQFVDAFPRSSALRRAVMPQVSNTLAPSGLRANAGFFNPTQSNVTVRVELRNESGTLVGQNVVTLAPLTQQQNAITGYFPGVDLSNATNLTMSFDASAPIFGYVSQVDNLSGDSFLIPGQPDPGVATTNQ
jgi:hypothetical protein